MHGQGIGVGPVHDKTCFCEAVTDSKLEEGLGYKTEKQKKRILRAEKLVALIP